MKIHVLRYEDLETILMRFVTSILLALDLFDYSYGTAWHPPASLPTAMGPSGPATGQSKLGVIAKTTGINHLTWYKTIARKITIAVVLLVVIDHLHHRLEGGDVQVRCWVNYIYLQ